MFVGPLDTIPLIVVQKCVNLDQYNAEADNLAVHLCDSSNELNHDLLFMPSQC